MGLSQAVIVECSGEAHSNAYIDYCGVCLPYWGSYPVCPTDAVKLSVTGWCKTCRKHFSINREKRFVHTPDSDLDAAPRQE